MIGIIDYGAGNLRSIINACIFLGYKTQIITKPEELEGVDKIILPGVGNFGSAMKKIERFQNSINSRIQDGVPFLGICLGIQVMFDESDESPDISGLSIFKGKCIRFPDNVKVPHMGWNSIYIRKKSPIIKGIPDNSMFYFAHSYYPVPENEDIIIATTEYELSFPSIVGYGNVFATQFHPEKSGKIGLKLLKNFLEI